LDPYQLVGTIQKYEGVMHIERFCARGGKANFELASTLRGLIVNKKIAWYSGCGELLIPDRHEGLKRETLTEELGDLLVESRPYGYRILNAPNKRDDRSVCVGMAVLTALKTERRVPFKLSPTYF